MKRSLDLYSVGHYLGAVRPSSMTSPGSSPCDGACDLVPMLTDTEDVTLTCYVPFIGIAVVSISGMTFHTLGCGYLLHVRKKNMP